MECPHVSDDVRGSSRLRELEGLLKDYVAEELTCEHCSELKDLWCCLRCGLVHCGRGSQAHALKHFEDTGHSVVTNLDRGSHYCYSCDDYVTNDDENGNLHRLTRLITQRQAETEDSSESQRFHSEPASKTKEPHDATRRREDDGEVGIQNLGNTCFMNSVLQSLSHTLPLRDFFAQGFEPGSQSGSAESSWHSLLMGCSPRSGGSSAVSVCDEFYALLRDMHAGKASVSPQIFLSTVWKVLPAFKGYRQHDAQEFMRCLLDRMDYELQQRRKLKGAPPQTDVATESPSNKTKPDEETESEIGRIFGGLLQNEITCLKCGYLSKKDDPFLDLSLDIPERDTHHPITLLDCLKSFTDVEVLEESEKYHCERCGSLQRISKKFSVKKAPEILCLHLKRFRWTRFFRAKIDAFVEFPLEHLDMSPFCSGDASLATYDLYATIVHLGGGPSSGHYVAFAKTSDQWSALNDTFVSATSTEEIARQHVYILFYRRKREESMREKLRSYTKHKQQSMSLK